MHYQQGRSAMTRLFNVVLLALALTACGNHSQREAPPPTPVIHRIAIIPAANPRWYTFENATPPVGYPLQFWVDKLDSRSKAYKFNAASKPADGAIGDRVDEEQAASAVDADAFVHL
jgi:hypothetical protein